MPTAPRIAVVGGGPAGLTIGLLLYKNSIPFTIFELRPKPTEEELAKPSGMLDLHADSGLTVLKECNLYDQFLPLTGECTEDFIIAERSGNTLFALNGGGTRPEISRNNLTKLLIESLPAESIRWSHKLLSATASPTATPDHAETVLDFGVNGKHTFDLVVGADGAWSKVRHLLTDTKPHYTGMQIITVTIKEITKKYPHLAKLIGSGSFSCHGNRHAVISQRGPYDSSRIYLWLTLPGQDLATSTGLAGKPATNAKEKLLEDDAFYGTYGPVIKELVTTACDEETTDNPGTSIDIKGLYSLPHGDSWVHKPGVTLVGDSAHLMLPNGEGVNVAMLDSLLLAQGVIQAYKKAGTDARSFQAAFDPLLKEFEVALVARAKEKGKDTEELIGKMFGSDDAGYDFADYLKGMMQQHAGH